MTTKSPEQALAEAQALLIAGMAQAENAQANREVVASRGTK